MTTHEEGATRMLDRPLARRARRPADGRVGESASHRGSFPDERPTDGSCPSNALETRAEFRLGAAVYGSFLVASVVGLAFEAGRDARAMTLTALASMFVFWLAHWWSEVLGARILAGRTFRARDAFVIARREWPLVEAAVLPALPLALSWAGAWSRETGAGLAMGAAVAQIVGWGYVAGRRAGATSLRAALFAAVEGVLGVALLLLESLIR